MKEQKKRTENKTKPNKNETQKTAAKFYYNILHREREGKRIVFCTHMSSNRSTPAIATATANNQYL